MLLKVLGSNSDGNCYILEDENEALILDAGVPFKDVKIALDFNVSKIVGVVITHQHSDHFKYAKEYIKAGIPVFIPWEMNSIELRRGSRFRIQAIPMTNLDNEWVHTNGDGSRCPIYGFLISSENLGRLVYITDVYLIKWRFSQIDHVIVEANFDMDKLDYSDDDDSKKNHTYLGHLSIQEACEFIKVCSDNSEDMQNVILCHLSSVNGNSTDFKSKVEEIFKGNVNIAQKGKIINLER